MTEDKSTGQRGRHQRRFTHIR